MAWWRYAKPGDKVVHVTKGIVSPSSWPSEKFILGNVYTIREIHPCLLGKTNTVYLLFEEVDISVRLDARGFRPLQKKSTDKAIAKLKTLLNGNRIPEEV